VFEGKSGGILNHTEALFKVLRIIVEFWR